MYKCSYKQKNDSSIRIRSCLPSEVLQQEVVVVVLANFLVGSKIEAEVPDYLFQILEI